MGTSHDPMCKMLAYGMSSRRLKKVFRLKSSNNAGPILRSKLNDFKQNRVETGFYPALHQWSNTYLYPLNANPLFP